MILFERVTIQEKVDLVRNLSLLVKSGLPINESFSLLAEQSSSPTLSKILHDARERMEQGTPIYRVFEKNKNFDNIFVSFIRAGEESGTLAENLNFLGDWLENESILRKEIKSATLYPKIVISVAVLLSGGLAVYVLPQLVTVFDTLDVELPWLTQALLWVSRVAQSHGALIFLGIFLLFLLIFLVSKIPLVKRVFDTIIIKIPFFGELAKEYQLAIIAQLTYTLFKSGLTIGQALEITKGSVTNTKYRNSIYKIKERVEKGTNLSSAMGEYPKLYPGVFISVVATGERTGSFSESFAYLGKFFSGRVLEKTKKLPTVLEPILLVLLGIFVALIAAAIIMPIYEVTKGIN